MKMAWSRREFLKTTTAAAVIGKIFCGRMRMR
jgi:hypothetical protein